MVDTVRVELAARALYRDGTRHIGDRVPFEYLWPALQAEWRRKAMVALVAADAAPVRLVRHG